MGAWYWIGVLAGIGAALGVLAVGILVRWPLAAVIGGVIGAAPIVTGALRRGGTRGGVALLVGGTAVAVAAIAFVPVLGYLEAAGMPGVATRARRRIPERHAGLRTLARD